MSRRILIAEDEAFIAGLYKVELELNGVEVIVAENGRVALQILKESQGGKVHSTFSSSIS